MSAAGVLWKKWGRDLQESRDNRASQQVRGLVNREPNTARKYQYRVESGLDLPMRFPLVDAVRDQHADRPDKEAIVDPCVRGTRSKEDLWAKDTPEHGLGVEVPGPNRVPGLGYNFARQFGAFVVDDEAHHAVVDEGPEKGAPHLPDEHLLLGDLHVEAELVVGDEVQILFEDLAPVDHAS